MKTRDKIKKEIDRLPEDHLEKVLDYLYKLIEKERESEWDDISLKGLDRGYDVDEPDYADVIVKEPNPEYRSSEGNR